MKTPRVTDFDPNAKSQSLKSPLEGMPVIQKGPSSPQPEKPVYQSENLITDRATARSEDGATGRPENRHTSGRGELIRRGFEWYADQLRALKKLSLEQQLDGKPGSMSAMVREALDEYIRKRTAKK